MSRAAAALKSAIPAFNAEAAKAGITPAIVITTGRDGTGSRLLHQFGVDRDLHVVADEDAAGLKHLVPLEAVVAPPDLRRRAEAAALAAPRIAAAALGRDVERHLAGHVADREIPYQLELVTVHAGDPRAAEGDVGEIVDVEEIGGPEVRVALWN